MQRFGYKPCFHLLTSLCQLSRILLFPSSESGDFTCNHFRVDEIPEKLKNSGKQGHRIWCLGCNIEELTLCCCGAKEVVPQCTEEMKVSQWVRCIPARSRMCGELERSDHCTEEGRDGGEKARAQEEGKRNI